MSTEKQSFMDKVLEKVDVIVNHINTELPFIVLRVNGTVEIFRFQEATILRTGKYPAKVVIADIKKIVITLQSIIIPSYHIIHQITDIVDKVIIHFVYIIILLRTEFQLICHTVGKETSVLSHFADTHGPHCGNSYT